MIVKNTNKFKYALIFVEKFTTNTIESVAQSKIHNIQNMSVNNSLRCIFKSHPCKRDMSHNSNAVNVDLSKYSLLVKMSTNMNTNQSKCAVYFKSHIQIITITSQHGTCATYSNIIQIIQVNM